MGASASSCIRIVGALGVVLACILAAPFSGLAADKDDRDDPKEEEKKPEGLEEIVKFVNELMTRVEDNLAQLRTGRRTQDDQKKIIEALKKVIDEAQQAADSQSSQQQQQQQQQQGGSSSQKQDQQQGHSEKQPDKRQEDQAQKQPLKPPAGTGKTPNVRRRERREPPQPRGNPIRKGPGTNAQKWGNLPPKDRRSVIDQWSQTVPPRFRSDVEKYWKRLAETDEE